MSKLLVRPHSPGAQGVILDITPQSAGWNCVGFKVHHLNAGQSVAGGVAGREVCIVVLTGIVDVAVGETSFRQLGGRNSVFEDAAPGAVYVPANMNYTITATREAEVAVCSAPGGGQQQPRRIEAAQMSREVRGQGTNQRFVRNILPETEPADSLLVVEVITPGGHWSSYPPHKHDRDAPGEESSLEETYYHRVNPPQGFAIQRVYTDDRSLDETISVQDRDVVMVVGAPHGYDLYYLNVMAGPKRTWIFKNDPVHDWIIKRT